jgi:hypothetical protein
MHGRGPLLIGNPRLFLRILVDDQQSRNEAKFGASASFQTICTIFAPRRILEPQQTSAHPPLRPSALRVPEIDTDAAADTRRRTISTPTAPSMTSSLHTTIFTSRARS